MNKAVTHAGMSALVKKEIARNHNPLVIGRIGQGMGKKNIKLQSLYK